MIESVYTIKKITKGYPTPNQLSYWRISSSTSHATYESTLRPSSPIAISPSTFAASTCFVAESLTTSSNVSIISTHFVTFVYICRFNFKRTKIYVVYWRNSWTTKLQSFFSPMANAMANITKHATRIILEFMTIVCLEFYFSTE